MQARDEGEATPIVAWVQVIDSSGRLGMKGNKAHRRSQSMPLEAAALPRSPRQLTWGLQHGQADADASSSSMPRRVRNSGGGGMSPYPSSQAPIQSPGHRRVASLSTGLVSLGVGCREASRPGLVGGGPSSSLREAEALMHLEADQAEQHSLGDARPGAPLRKRAEVPSATTDSTSPTGSADNRTFSRDEFSPGGFASSSPPPPLSSSLPLPPSSKRSLTPPRNDTSARFQAGANSPPRRQVPALDAPAPQASKDTHGVARTVDSHVRAWMPQATRQRSIGSTAAVVGSPQMFLGEEATRRPGEPGGSCDRWRPRQSQQQQQQQEHRGIASRIEEALDDSRRRCEGSPSFKAEGEGWRPHVEAAQLLGTPPHGKEEHVARDNHARTLVVSGAGSEGGNEGNTPPGAVVNEDIDERRGSMLELYREPEGHEWGVLEDWQDLPGLGLAGLGGGGGAGISSRLQNSALIFRPGTVDEGDVLSLLGRPRSREPEPVSPATHGPAQIQIDCTAVAASSARRNGGNNSRDGSGSDDGSGSSASTHGVDMVWSRVTKSATQPRADLDEAFDSAEGQNSLVASPTRARAPEGAAEGRPSSWRAGGVGGGGGAQPLLLSLADLTTAGLQKLLQAEGDSKMFFDPDAQRWVGEEVDLSGFEDTLPASGPAPSSIRSISPAAATGAAAGAVTPESAAVGASAGWSPHAAPKSPLVTRGNGTPFAGSHAASPPSQRITPVGAHRRWSSGEAAPGGDRSSRQQSLTTDTRSGDWGALSADGRSFHRRRHSSSVAGHFSAEAGFGTTRGVPRGKIRTRPDSRPSSGASSSLRSDSDTGSVIRLWDLSAADSRSNGTGAGDGQGSRGSGGGDGGGGAVGGRSSGGGDRHSGSLKSRSFSSGGRLGVGGNDQLTLVFEESSSFDSPNRGVRVTSRQSAGTPHAADGKGEEPSRQTEWPWAASMSLQSQHPHLPAGGGEPSGSDIGASDMSDWDQDDDFGGLPEDHSFTLTFEQPAKFGYSPAMPEGHGEGGIGTGGLGDASANGTGDGTGGGGGDAPIPLSGKDDRLPLVAPSLFRYMTAPATIARDGQLGHGDAGAYMQWPLKMSADAGERDGAGAASRGGKIGRTHQRHGSYADRCDSLGSAGEWDQTLEGELDISLAHRPRTPVLAGPSRPRNTASPKANRTSSMSNIGEACTISSGSGSASVNVGKEGIANAKEPRSAMGLAWEALRAHRGGASLQDTVRAAASTAMSMAVEHVRNRSRTRLLLEKGAGSGKRLSGPVQITLEDLQASPAPEGVPTGEGGDGSGEAVSQPTANAAAAAGARYNGEKMRWEGFEEPDLSAFDTTDSECGSDSRDASPERSPLRVPPEGGSDRDRSGIDGEADTGGLAARPASGLEHAEPGDAGALHETRQQEETEETAREGRPDDAETAERASRGDSGAFVDDGPTGDSLGPSDAAHISAHADTSGDGQSEIFLGGVDFDDGQVEADAHEVEREVDVEPAVSPASGNSALALDTDVVQDPLLNAGCAEVSNSFADMRQSASEHRQARDVAGEERDAEAQEAKTFHNVRDSEEQLVSPRPDGSGSGSGSGSNNSRSSSSSSSNSEISDWDRSLGSASPPLEGATGTVNSTICSAATFGPTDSAQAGPIQAATQSQAPESMGAGGNMLFCAANGGGSSVAWLASTNAGPVGVRAPGQSAKKTSSGPVLFTLAKTGRGCGGGDDAPTGQPPASLSCQVQASTLPSSSFSADATVCEVSDIDTGRHGGSSGSGHVDSFTLARSSPLDHGRTSPELGLGAGVRLGSPVGPGNLVGEDIDPEASQPDVVLPARRHVETAPAPGVVSASMDVLEATPIESEGVCDGGDGGQDAGAKGQSALVPRSINGGPVGEAFGLSTGEADIVASASHFTKSTEDDTVDDWGADFVGGIVLTPKIGDIPGTPWEIGQTALLLEERDEEQDSDDSCMAICDDSPPHGHHASLEIPQQQGLFDESSPHHTHSSSLEIDNDESTWSAPEMSASAGSGSASTQRWRNYGRVVTRIGGGFPNFFPNFFRSSHRRSPEDGGLRDSSSEDEVDSVVEGDGEARERPGVTSKFRKRPKRVRGYQTITKAEYTPIYVPHAWLNPKTESWEPVDGYAVDMSRFGTDDEEDDASTRSRQRSRKPAPRLSALALSSTAGAGGGGTSGGHSDSVGSINSPPLTRGPSASSAGTGGETPMSQERRRRTSVVENRATAFKLSPDALRQLSRSEQAHDRAMTLFLGEQGYARAKTRGKARLERMAGMIHEMDEPSVLPDTTPLELAAPQLRRARSMDPTSLADLVEGSSSVDSGAGSRTVSDVVGEKPEALTEQATTETPPPSPPAPVAAAAAAAAAPARSRLSAGVSALFGKASPPAQAVKKVQGRFTVASPSRDHRPMPAASKPSPALSPKCAASPREKRARSRTGTLSRSPLGSQTPDAKPGRSEAAATESSEHSPVRGKARLPSRGGTPRAARAGSGAAPSPAKEQRKTRLPLSKSPASSPPRKQLSSASTPTASGVRSTSGSTGSYNAQGRKLNPERQRRLSGKTAAKGTATGAGAAVPTAEKKAAPATARGRRVTTPDDRWPRLSSRSSADGGLGRAVLGIPPNASGSGEPPAAGVNARRKDVHRFDRRRSGATGVSPPAREGLGARRKRQNVIASAGSEAISSRASRAPARSALNATAAGGVGRRAVAGVMRKGSSPRRSPRVLRSPPRRCGIESALRRATIASPSYPAHRKGLQRTTSTGELARLERAGKSRSIDDAGGAGGASVEVAAAVAAEVVAAEGRQRVIQRLARFVDMTEFAETMVRERFSLAGTRGVSETPSVGDRPMRRGHRRRRSGGDSSTGCGSTGSGSSVGRLSMAGLTLRR